MKHVSTASKAWLHLECPSWHKVKQPETPDIAGPRALFGTYIHKVAQNEMLRQTGQTTGNVISDQMTAEQEAAFNPHFTQEIGAPFDAEEWGNNVHKMVKELLLLFPDKSIYWHCESGFYTQSGEGYKADIKNRDYSDLPEFCIPGTIDAAGVKQGHPSGSDLLVVVDWKTGEEPVSPKNNAQLVLAAFAMLEHYALRSDAEIYLGIGNIRKNTLEFHKATYGDVVSMNRMIHEAKNKPETTLQPGAHCAKCPNQVYCPALSKKIINAGDPKDWTADQLAVAAIQARDIGKKYRELLIHKAETDPTFKSKYLKKGSQGWRLSVFEGNKE